MLQISTEQTEGIFQVIAWRIVLLMEVRNMMRKMEHLEQRMQS